MGFIWHSIPRTMGRLSTVDRERGIGMLQAGLSAAEVARRLQVHKSTISRLATRFQETGATADRQRPGRPRETTPAQDRHIRVSHLRNRTRPATRTAQQTPGRTNNRISAQTVRNRLQEHHLHARRPYRGQILTQARRQARQQWATAHTRWTHQQWRDVLFTDESRFTLYHADGRTRVWRRRGERYSDACVLETDRFGGASVMVWGGISFTAKTQLIFIEGNLNAARYRDEILQPVAVPFIRHHQLHLLQQDNARPHAARLTMDFLQGEGINVLPWPAFSPDINPIEHLWDYLDQRVRRRDPAPANRQQLCQALQEEWDRVPRQMVQRLVSSMRRRCIAVTDADGGHTQY